MCLVQIYPKIVNFCRDESLLGRSKTLSENVKCTFLSLILPLQLLGNLISVVLLLVGVYPLSPLQPYRWWSFLDPRRSSILGSLHRPRVPLTTHSESDPLQGLRTGGRGGFPILRVLPGLRCPDCVEFLVTSDFFKDGDHWVVVLRGKGPDTETYLSVLTSGPDLLYWGLSSFWLTRRSDNLES